MQDQHSNITYGAYARRSSEQEDRQVASIESQKRELGELAQRDSLFITRHFEESHSAKRPGRPVFNELVAAFERGDITGLLTWSPNRISRNAIDTGIIIDLMDRDKLLEIRTPAQTYRNTPNDKFLLGLFCGQAKLENDNKGIDVKRGLKTKAEQGIYPAPAPLGYLNDPSAKPGNKKILVDPDRFDLVRRMFDLMLTGRYTPPRILAIANEEWGFRTPLGYKMSRSNIYNIFSRPFYFGRFEYPAGSGNWYTGIHKPMITEDEHRRIQSLFRHSARPKARQGGLRFPYRGPLRCGACRAMITAEKKTKHQQNGNVHEYVYYHCTKRKDPNCTQPSIREDRLEKQIEQLLAQIELPDEFRSWGLACLEAHSHNDAATQQALKDNLQRSIDGCENKIDRLIDMRANDELTEQEFARKKVAIAREQETFRHQLAVMDQYSHDWRDAVNNLLAFAEKVRSRFQTGDRDKRQQIFAALGSNLLLADKKLAVERNHWVHPLRRLARRVQAIHARLEPRKTRMNAEQMGEIYSRSPGMLRALDDVRTCLGKTGTTQSSSASQIVISSALPPDLSPIITTI